VLEGENILCFVALLQNLSEVVK